MVDIGFTGTQNGTTAMQRDALFAKLSEMEHDITTAHHGECIGADTDFHLACLFLRIPIIGHPPINTSKKAFLTGFLFEWEPKEYLDRNKNIVCCSKDLLIACPGEFKEQLRSGTWSTVRFARKTRVPRYIIFPDGSVKEENNVLL